MREQQAEFHRLGAVVVGVTFEPPAVLALLGKTEGLPFPVLSDPTRRAYAAFGMQRGRPGQIWNWNTIKAYGRGLLQGRWPRLPHGDLAQLGGDVVVGPDGRVILLHRSQEVADRPPVEKVLAAVRSSLGDES